MYRIFPLIFLLLGSLGATAQTVQIGTGTDISATTSYGPVYRFSATSTTTSARYDLLYTAAEMAAAGVPTGATITSIQFNKSNSANFVTPASNYSLYMANTANTALATTLPWATVLSTHTLVYNSTSFNMPLAAGWVTWTLSTPFVYTGGALEVAGDMTMGGNGAATDNFQWQYTSTIPADRIVGVTTAATANLSGTVATYKVRPNIKITYTSSSVCTSPPTPGVAASDATGSVCANSTVNLSLTGNSSGSGQSYQWQRATTSGGTYSNIGTSSTATGTSITPTATYFYRVAVTCGTSTTYSTPVQVAVTAGLAAGTYTVNPAAAASSTNFTSFASVATALSCGVMGNVVFNIASGTYNNQIVIPNLLGTSPTSRVTFQSATGNPANVTIQATSTSTTDNYVVKLDGASYVTLRNVTLKNNGTTYARCLELTTTASNDSIAGCVLTGATTTTSSNNTAKIYATALTGNDNVILNNTIQNGSYGIYLYGTTVLTTQPSNTVVQGNTVTGSNNYAMYIYYMDNLKLRNNTITANNTATCYGMYINYCDNALEIVKNNVSLTGSGTKYAIYPYDCEGTATAMGLVANNVIYVSNGTGAGAGLRGYLGYYQRYYNNTVNFNSTSTTGYAAYFYQSSATLYNNNEIRNNVFANTGTGYALYVYNPTYAAGTNNSWDYNNLFTNGVNLVDRGSPAADFTTLTAWRAASGLEMNSISYNPGFTSATNLAPDPANPASWSVNGRGVHLAINNSDINGNARVTTRAAGVPDLGAYEFTPTATPPAATATPATPTAGTSQYFTFGEDTVAVMDWTAATAVPATITVRQYTGTTPPQLLATSPSSYMYFYVHADVPTGTYDYTPNIYYKKPWLGTIASETNMKLVKRETPTAPWIGYNFTESNTNTTRNFITSANRTSLGYFSGIDNDIIFVARITPGNTAFCPGGNALLTANAGTGITYRWKLNGGYIPGATSMTYPATTAGAYMVEETRNSAVVNSEPVNIVSVNPPVAAITAPTSVICVGGQEILQATTGTDLTYQWQQDGSDMPGQTNATLAATAAGNYTVTVTNPGCSTTSPQFTVSAVPLPMPVVSPDTSVTLCNGNSILMQASIPPTGLMSLQYQWMNNGSAIPGATNSTYMTGDQGNYTVILSSGTCPATVSAGTNVFEVPNPEPIITLNGLTMSTGVYSSYQWYKDGQVIPGANTFNHTASENGDYTVDVSNGDCTGLSDAYKLRSVSVADIDAAKAEVSIYPNPVSSVVYIKSQNPVNVILMSMEGKVLRNISDAKQIDMGNYPDGVYFLGISDAQNVRIKTEKIIKSSK